MLVEKLASFLLKFNKSINNFWFNQKLLIDLLNFKRIFGAFNNFLSESFLLYLKKGVESFIFFDIYDIFKE